MRHRILIILALSVLCSTFEIKRLDDEAHYILRSFTEKDWWETAVFYQIYPRSFMDSNGDGIGDLQGITQKLDYLKDTGITAAWLSPIFKSPQVDQGYDVSDYLDIDPDYGTLDDLKQLLAKAKELGIKIILDFVPNHTSDQHEWFNKSVNKEEGFEDFYVWQNASSFIGNEPQPPNNWISTFKGSAWEWNNDRQQFYFHQFTVQQPDLNYYNPEVIKTIKDVLTFWLDFGVDGFRIDAVPYLFEDEEYRNEELAPGYKQYDINDPNCLDRKYTKDLDKTFDVIYEFRELLDGYSMNKETETKVMMTEAYSSIEKEMLYYGTTNGSKLGAHFTFNFNFISAQPTVESITYCINEWLSHIPEIYTSNWVLGNHDNHRVATRFGKENIDGFNMLTAILPGVMVTYNGEEIGMEDGEVTCEESQDPQVTNCSTFDQISRDFERTPFQWDNSTYAGFSNVTPWLPVSSKKDEVNLEVENVEEIQSHYNVYKALLEFRKIFRNESNYDTVSVVELSKSVLQIIRIVDDQEYDLIYNLGDSKETINFFRRKNSYKVVVASVGSSSSPGDAVGQLELQPHESILIQGLSNNMTTETPDGSTSSHETTTKGHAENVLPCIALLLVCGIFALF